MQVNAFQDVLKLDIKSATILKISVPHLQIGNTAHYSFPRSLHLFSDLNGLFSAVFS